MIFYIIGVIYLILCAVASWGMQNYLYISAVEQGRKPTKHKVGHFSSIGSKRYSVGMYEHDRVGFFLVLSYGGFAPFGLPYIYKYVNNYYEPDKVSLKEKLNKPMEWAVRELTSPRTNVKEIEK